MKLPHSVTAEQALLGLIMAEPKRFDIVAERLTADDFYVPLYAEIYRTAESLLSEKLEPNPIAVSERMDCQPWGGTESVLQECVAFYEAASTSADMATIAYVVSEHAYQRKLIAAAGELTKAANDNRVEDAKAYQKLIAELSQTFVQRQATTPLIQVREALTKAKQKTNMLKSGVYGWDNQFGGLFKGSRYIIAGHGGAGKSALAVNIGWNIAKAGGRVRWLSYEEEPHALWWRIMARETGVPYTAFRHGLSDGQEAELVEKQGRYTGPDFLAFYNVPDVGQMINACGLCDLIVLDGITSAPAEGASNKIEKAGVVTEYCAKLAAKTGAAVIMLAHVNSDSLKTGASMTGIYGGQAATFDPEGIIDLRWADDNRRAITMKVLKNRYGASGLTETLNFKYERMEVV